MLEVVVAAITPNATSHEDGNFAELRKTPMLERRN